MARVILRLALVTAATAIACIAALCAYAQHQVTHPPPRIPWDVYE